MTGAFHRGERRICGIRDMPVTFDRSGVENEVGGGRTSGEPRLQPQRTPCVRMTPSLWIAVLGEAPGSYRRVIFPRYDTCFFQRAITW
jgi:hypothetical protein